LTYPLDHLAGLQVLFQALLNFNPIVNLYQAPASTVHPAIDKNQITHLSCTPTFLRMMLAGEEALGRIALFVLRDGVGEIGIIMRREATGRGFASKAVHLVVDHAFGALGLHRITADIDPDNSASISLFLRAGFQREGMLRGNWTTHIGVRDSVIMGKLRDEDAASG
jgi:RimJ/RimL family protein N-acetyltransferase